MPVTIETPTLRSEIRSRLETVTHGDAREVARGILSDLTPTLLTEAAEIGVARIVKQEWNTLRDRVTHATPTQGSGRWDRVAETAEEIFGVRYYLGLPHGGKCLGECTVNDLVAMEDAYRARAETHARDANAFAKLRGLLRSKNKLSVGRLPAATVRGCFDE